jgi:DNA-binding PadR family transcriptional regulator
MATTTDRRPELPATSYAILGLLSLGGECSGYDLGKIVARTIGFFWTPAKSQLYAELRRLAAAGYATERRVEQADRPDKRLYEITPEGLEALREWLEEAPVELEPIKSVFLLKVFFGHLMGPAAVAAQVRDYRREMQTMLDQLRAIEAHIPEEPTTPYPFYALRYGIAYARATIGWCDETLKQLTKNEEER